MNLLNHEVIVSFFIYLTIFNAYVFKTIWKLTVFTNIIKVKSPTLIKDHLTIINNDNLSGKRSK
ncbi:MAG: hypothetical protein ACD_50C00311G0011 [uncultured bacterium]|nr:MAG: hypothetical protein ACD_50C00311G0011 [uncultured bacterium]